MKKSPFGLIIILILLTTFYPKINFFKSLNLNIKEIKIENNFIIKDDEIRNKLNFLYDKNLFFLNTEKVKEIFQKEDFIESLVIKKIYPNKLKLIIEEKKPIAILHNKKKKYYISNKGELINFIEIDRYHDLPTVLGGFKNFYSLYLELQNIKFPLKMIKSFYFFESGRWDLIMHNDKIIKLPIDDYLSSLKSFMLSKQNTNFNAYKIFDYRIKNQLILN